MRNAERGLDDSLAWLRFLLHAVVSHRRMRLGTLSAIAVLLSTIKVLSTPLAQVLPDTETGEKHFSSHPAGEGELPVMAVEIIRAHPEAAAGFPDIEQLIRLGLATGRGEPRQRGGPDFLQVA
jgi:hypothetical protein